MHAIAVHFTRRRFPGVQGQLDLGVAGQKRIHDARHPASGQRTVYLQRHFTADLLAKFCQRLLAVGGHGQQLGAVLMKQQARFGGNQTVRLATQQRLVQPGF